MPDGLAGFIAEFDATLLEDRVIRKATAAVIDGLSTILAGSKEESSVLLRRALVSAGQMTGSSVVIGTDQSAGMLDAALCNGAAGHAQDFDDILQGFTTHPTTHLLPPLLAIAQERPTTGAEFMRAYIVGLEVEMGIAQAMGRQHYNQGWHSTGTLGTVGATAAACSLLRLSAEQVQNALSTAYSSAGGLRANSGTMVKPMHSAHAARTGLEAALLAAQGFVGAGEGLTARYGYLETYSGISPLADPRWNTEEARRGTAVDRLTLKPYPCCGEATAQVEAILAIREEIPAARVARIAIRTCPLGGQVLRFRVPATPDNARFSAPYCVSAAMWNGRLDLDDFTEEAVRRPEVLALIDRIELSVDDAVPDPGAVVEVWGKNGEHAMRRILTPQGHYSVGLPDETALQKFVACGRSVLNADEATAFYRQLQSIVELPDVAAALVPYLVSRPTAGERTNIGVELV